MKEEFLSSEKRLTPLLKKSDFTIGPEEKPIYKITTETGLVLSMTENHPVLKMGEKFEEMTQARLLKVGDFVFNETHKKLKVIKIESSILPKNNNLVYNVNAQSKTLKNSVILANGIKVGDMKWQKHLEEYHQRSALVKQLAEEDRNDKR